MPIFIWFYAESSIRHPTALCSCHLWEQTSPRRTHREHVMGSVTSHVAPNRQATSSAMGSEHVWSLWGAQCSRSSILSGLGRAMPRCRRMLRGATPLMKIVSAALFRHDPTQGQARSCIPEPGSSCQRYAVSVDRGSKPLDPKGSRLAPQQD